VLGDMRELGVHSDDAHALVGHLAAELRVDVLIGVGTGGRAITVAAASGDHGVPEVRTVSDAGEALRAVRGVAARGDTVLVKASRDVGLEVVAEQLLHTGTSGVAS
jgi:UDP-N-acetylmuramoyl-tripeptide--D-alanyl-D-alanine ligase